ncbi:MAG: hypothetical protein H0V39_07305 [Nitrosomonas sp.]|nr:hypothetical protein [Nitrosomonas sp.]
MADFLIKNKLSVLPAIGLVGLIFFLPLLTSPSYAHNSSTADPDMQLLLQKLKERDAIIDDLNRRVKVLEGQQGSPAPQQQTTSTPVAPVNRAQTPGSTRSSSQT